MEKHQKTTVESAKDAANLAAKYLTDFYGSASISGLRLEEIERQGNNWVVTLGYSESGVDLVGVGFLNRHYKVVTINASNGDFISMKVRKLD